MTGMCRDYETTVTPTLKCHNSRPYPDEDEDDGEDDGEDVEDDEVPRLRDYRHTNIKMSQF